MAHTKQGARVHLEIETKAEVEAKILYEQIDAGKHS